MKKCFLIITMICSLGSLQGQTSFSLAAGYLFTHTSVAEYKRPNFNYYLLDEVSIDPNRNSFHASLTVDLDLGTRFFLSTGLHYEEMGISNVSFTDTLNDFYSYQANQHYIGWSLLLKYHYQFRNSKFGIFAGVGPKVDVAVGYLNIAEQAPWMAANTLTPFARFNTIDFSIAAEAGITCLLGPGSLFAKVNYFQGLSDVLRDDYLVAKTISLGVDVGYTLPFSFFSSKKSQARTN
ncbi:MAG: PorT family protein [Bacteroidales bacterium]|nr:PorT family protein [Bacteroidales bacterium]